MTEVRGQTTRRFCNFLRPVSGVIHEPRSVTSDVQATTRATARFPRPQALILLGPPLAVAVAVYTISDTFL